MSSTTAPMTDAPAEKKPGAARRKMRGRNKLLLIIFSLLMMGLLRTAFVFFLIGMLPAIVAYFMDVSKHRYNFKSIFACNLSGMLPFVGQIVRHHSSSIVLQDIMSHAANWIIIYGSAIMGLLLVRICPIIAQTMIVGYHQTQVARMQTIQKKIETEWGPEVTQFSHPESMIVHD